MNWKDRLFGPKWSHIEKLEGDVAFWVGAAEERKHRYWDLSRQYNALAESVGLPGHDPFETGRKAVTKILEDKPRAVKGETGKRYARRATSYQVAEHFGMGPKTITELARRGKIPATRLKTHQNRAWRFSIPELDDGYADMFTNARNRDTLGMKERASLGGEFRAIRNRLGMDQMGISQAIGFNQASVSEVETGAPRASVKRVLAVMDAARKMESGEHRASPHYKMAKEAPLKEPHPEQRMYTFPEVESLTGVNRRLLIHWSRTGQLANRKVGSSYMVPESEVQALRVRRVESEEEGYGK